MTSTGDNPEEVWNSFLEHRTGIHPANTSKWPTHFKRYWLDQPNRPIVCQIQKERSSAREFLSVELARLASPQITQNGRWGVILSTTKGAVEDYVWENDFLDRKIDPLNEVLKSTVGILNKNFILEEVVSNSCASSHGAISVAKRWIQSGACDHVLVLAGDMIGPFIQTGFQSLKALSHSGGRPFQADRDGLVLGEALTALVMTKEKTEIELVGIEILNESHTVTGPSPEGRGLQNCINKLPDLIPDIAIAHGTATLLNDQTEDHVLAQAQKKFGRDFYISGTKWSIGHTLGASGSIDLITAIESLKRGVLFPISRRTNSHELKANGYVFGDSVTGDFKTALITSLGFGGTNGAILIKRGEL